MTSRWVNPINNNILHDLQNNVLASGSVAFYEAGTSTPLAVYSDPELTVSLGSYIDADAYGLLPDFHMAAGTQYKAVAYDAIGGAGGAGAIKWTRDDVFSADSSVDTRLDSIESTLDALDIADNLIINGGMRVASGSAVTATTSYLETQVTSVFGKVANVTAGTMAQAQDDDYVSGYALAFSGVSTDNAAATVDAQFRIQSKDCFGLVNEPAVFFCQVEHDVGSSVDYTITVSAANAADDFSAITTISAGSAVSVASGTKTRLDLSVADLGDVSNGIAITVSAACGTITTKEFKISESQLQKGSTASAFSQLPYDVVNAAVGFEEVETLSGNIPVLLSTTAITAVASIDLPTVFSDNASYRYFMVIVEDADPASTEELLLRLSVDGSTFRSTASDYIWAYNKSSSSTASAEYNRSTGATSIQLGAARGIDESALDKILFVNPHDTSRTTPVRFERTTSLGTIVDEVTGVGAFKSTNDAITGFQLLWDGAVSFTARGSVKVYGSNLPF